jgi:hypothetical protein
MHIDYTICRNLSDGVPCPILGHKSTYFLACPYNTDVSKGKENFSIHI